jgi:hypothetical protein
MFGSFRDLAFLGAAAGSGVALDPDAQAYITAVETVDGQALEAGVRAAINDFVVGCKADGIWTAIKASCILAGARTLNGALVPLVGTAPTNFNFVSGDYNRKTGLVGNGSTKYLNSNYSLIEALQNNRHVSVWVQSPQSSGSHAYAGSSLTPVEAAARSQIVAASGSETRLITRLADETSVTSATANNVTGLQGVSRTSAPSYTRRAALANATVSTASLSGNDNQMWIFARNNNASNLHTSARLAFYSIGESLDLALLDARVTTLINAFAAVIP